MSARSIALFDDHQRAKSNERTTVPAPPAHDPIAQLEAEERKFAHRASRALQRALECRAMIEFLRGQSANHAKEPQ